jgi:two-component system, NarL family, invasion response regulator UvrY
MIRILLADDHAILRQGLKQILADEMPDALFGEAGDAAGALALLHQQTWDVIVLDISMPGRNGFEVLDEVRRHFPLLPVLVLSSTPEDQIGVRVMKGGASGYLNKQAAPEKLVEAVQKVLAGGQFIGSTLAHKLVAELRRGTNQPAHASLSERERQVCKLIASGKSLKEIAAELSLSVKTISTFRNRGFVKLGLKNDVELVHYAREEGLVEGTESVAR